MAYSTRWQFGNIKFRVRNYNVYIFANSVDDFCVCARGDLYDVTKKLDDGEIERVKRKIAKSI